MEEQSETSSTSRRIVRSTTVPVMIPPLERITSLSQDPGSSLLRRSLPLSSRRKKKGMMRTSPSLGSYNRRSYSSLPSLGSHNQRTVRYPSIGHPDKNETKQTSTPTPKIESRHIYRAMKSSRIHHANHIRPSSRRTFFTPQSSPSSRRQKSKMRTNSSSPSLGSNDHRRARHASAYTPSSRCQYPSQTSGPSPTPRRFFPLKKRLYIVPPINSEGTIKSILVSDLQKEKKSDEITRGDSMESGRSNPEKQFVSKLYDEIQTFESMVAKLEEEKREWLRKKEGIGRFNENKSLE
eukprot:jgi/Bigna1/71236/fgenesh1_pg.15_\